MTEATDGGGRLQGRLIGLGVCGSIAAYKSVELLRGLTAEGADVVVMLTPSATRFVGPLTFRALSPPPRRDRRPRPPPRPADRPIVIADTADAIVVAPATARWLGAMAGGHRGRRGARGLPRDDGAGRGRARDGRRHVDAPGDAHQRRAPAARVRLPGRRARGGAARVGQSGIGRLAELGDIVEAVVAAVGDAPIRQPGAAARPPVVDRLGALDLEGRRIVVTAGGTARADRPGPVHRQSQQRQDGARDRRRRVGRGARVTLVAGRLEVPIPPASTRDPPNRRPRCATRSSMAVLHSAAPTPSSWPPPSPTSARPRGNDQAHPRRGLTLELEPTEDILAEVGARAPRSSDPRPVIVGFAAETGSLERAPDKLRRKGADLLVANDVAEAGSGFGTDTNRVSILGAGRLARRPPAAHEARGRGPAAGPGRAAVGRTRGAGADWADQHGEPPMSAQTESTRRLSVVDIAKLYADGVRIATITAYDFPTARARRRGRHPADPRRRLARRR